MNIVQIFTDAKNIVLENPIDFTITVGSHTMVAILFFLLGCVFMYWFLITFSSRLIKTISGAIPFANNKDENTFRK